MFIERLERRHDAELIALLDSLAGKPCGPAVLGYHYPENREMLEEVLGPQSTACFLAARTHATGPLKAVLPGMIHRSQDAACYNSLPFFGPNAGALAAVDDPNEYAALAGELTAAALDTAREANALTAVFYSPFNPLDASLRNPQLDSRDDVVRIPKKTWYVQITPGQDHKWPADIRYDLRKATAAGVEISTDCSPAELDEIYAIYEQNCIDYGIPIKPKRCLNMFREQGQRSRRVHLYTARLKGRVIGGLIVLWGPLTASYYLPCSLAEFRSLQPGSLAIDRACRDAAAAGLKYWNWESSPDDAPGVANFKKKWDSRSSNYETCVVPLRDALELQSYSPQSLTERFPFYFVYPYHLLKNPAK